MMASEPTQPLSHMRRIRLLRAKLRSALIIAGRVHLPVSHQQDTILDAAPLHLILLRGGVASQLTYNWQAKIYGLGIFSSDVNGEAGNPALLNRFATGAFAHP
jgi:hypothetical protein